MKEGEDCIHLTVEAVNLIHARSIERFGGSDGLRSIELLESAIAAPQAEFAGKSPFADVIEIGAAYLYYLCSNHPFVDGNKRVALASCLVFLKLNKVKTPPDSVDWETLTLDVASGNISRDETTKRLRELLAHQSR